MNDLDEVYRMLVREADLRVLEGPEVVRRQVDRHVRRLALSGVVVVAALVGLGTAAVRVALQSNPGPEWGNTPPSVSPTPLDPTREPSVPTPTHTPPTSPSAGLTGGPSSIPLTAFLQAADVFNNMPPNESADRTLPELCGFNLPGKAAQKASYALGIDYSRAAGQTENIPYGTFRETIVSFQAGRATTFMSDVRAAVAGCPEQTINGLLHTTRVVATPRYGDDSVVIEDQFPTLDYVRGTPTGGTTVAYTSVVRIGDVVMVLRDVGYEGATGDRTSHLAFTEKATHRVNDWLK